MIIIFFLNQFSNFEGQKTENHNPAIEFNDEHVEGCENMININLKGSSVLGRCYIDFTPAHITATGLVPKSVR